MGNNELKKVRFKNLTSCDDKISKLVETEKF